MGELEQRVRELVAAPAAELAEVLARVRDALLEIAQAIEDS